jgi:hypothetical protein
MSGCAGPDPERPQQFHLDMTVEGMDRAQTEVLALGATLLDDRDCRSDFRIFADPTGPRSACLP